MSWDSRLKEQAERKYNNYKVHRISLVNALDNKEFPLPGDTIIVVGASSSVASATIRFNLNNNEPLPLYARKKYSTIFTSFFVSCLAQAGEWLDVLVGIDFDDEDLFDYLEYFGQAQGLLVVTNATPNVDTAVANHLCKAVLIKAFKNNSGIAWVNFNSPAVADACFQLAQNDEVPVPLSNTNKIHALFESANDKLFIIYRN